MLKTLIYSFSMISILSSCGGWSESDKKNFLDDCEKSKFSRSYCDCALNKMTSTYSTFNDMVEDEENSAKLLVGCIEEDRKKEE